MVFSNICLRDVVGEVVNLAEDFLVSGAAIDRFLADQLLIYMAISKAGYYNDQRAFQPPSNKYGNNKEVP